MTARMLASAASSGAIRKGRKYQTTQTVEIERVNERGEPAGKVEVAIPHDPESSINILSGLLADLRCVRDTGAFTESAHTFREWCMSKFGEKLGAFIEENL